MKIKTCIILGVPVAVINMEQTVKYLEENMLKLKGKYITVCNVHTTVMAYEDEKYGKVQNQAALALPDGKPLSIVSKFRGHKEAQRVTGPDLMGEMFQRGQAGNGLKHYFYGGKPETLDKLEKELGRKYPDLQIAGMYSPPFRKLTEEEKREDIRRINESKADIIWVGLGAPKQENWMYEHKGVLHGVSIGVGAGFDYHAGEIKRAPAWMQKMSLEWLARLMQDPKRLWKRYLVTNVKFIWYMMTGKNREKGK